LDRYLSGEPLILEFAVRIFLFILIPIRDEPRAGSRRNITELSELVWKS
jgi:hypothetical protein